MAEGPARPGCGEAPQLIVEAVRKARWAVSMRWRLLRSVPRHSPTIISPRKQALILGAIPQQRRGGAFLALCHGVRPGEAPALDLPDVPEREGAKGSPGLLVLVRKAMEGRPCTSPLGATKTGEAAWITINNEFAEWIAWRLAPSATRTYLGRQHSLRESEGPSGGGARPRTALDPRALRTAWLRVCAEVGVDVGLYEGTKHSSATAWRSGGMSLEHVRRMLRHRDARSTETQSFSIEDGARAGAKPPSRVMSS